MLEDTKINNIDYIRFLKALGAEPEKIPPLCTYIPTTAKPTDKSEKAEKATIIRLDLQNGQLNTKKYSIEDIEKLKDIGIDIRT